MNNYLNKRFRPIEFSVTAHIFQKIKLYFTKKYLQIFFKSFYYRHGWSAKALWSKLYVILVITYASSVGFLLANNKFRRPRAEEEKALAYREL